MVNLVAGRAGVEVAELVAAAAGDVLAIVVMIGVVRVVKAAMTGVGRVVMIEVKTGVGRVGSGSRVVKFGMNVVVRVVTIVVGRVGSGSRVVRAVTLGAVRVVMTAVRDSVMIAMTRQSLQRSSVARRCSHVRARVSTVKTNRLLSAKLVMSVLLTRVRCAASAFGVMNPSARSAARDEIAEARRFRHRLRLRIHWRGKYGKPLAIGVMTL